MPRKRSSLAESFEQFLTESEIDGIAAETGFLRRKRKATPFRFVTCLVFGLAAEGRRTLAGLRRFFAAVTGETITSAAFQKRFNDAAAAMFRTIFDRLFTRLRDTSGRALPRKLRMFKDVIAVDSTVFALHDRLARHFRGFRSEGTRAMARVTTALSLREHAPSQIEISSGRRSETRCFRIVKALAGRLVVMDLGFFSFDRFAALARVGAFFLSRLKDGVNPEILSVRMGLGGRRSPAGGKFRSVRFKDPFVDLDARFGSGEHTFDARVIGEWNEETGEYHWYLTNIAPEAFGPRDVAEIYRLRWQVELLYKEWKSLFRLDEIPSGKKATVQCLILATLIAHLLVKLMARLLLGRAPWQYSPRKWAQYVLQFANRIAAAVLARNRDGLERILSTIHKTAPAEVMTLRPSTAAIYNVCLL